MPDPDLPIIFGPVFSRRFGRSLGVDLSPSKKQCNFDCVYCELKKAKPMNFMREVLPKELIIKSIKSALKNCSDIDVLTFSANGEPTLYPYLYEVISAIKPLVPKHCKTLILSNGSRFKEQKKALSLFDMVKFSLDGGISRDYKRTDRPSQNLTLEHILGGIRDFAKDYKGDLIAEVLIVKDFNDSKENLLAIVKFLRSIKVSRVDLSSIDRPSAYNVKAVDRDTLRGFVPYFEGLCVNLPERTLPQSHITQKSYTKNDLIKLIATRPIEVLEAQVLFTPDTLCVLRELLDSRIIIIKDSANRKFYTFGGHYAD